MVNGALKDPIWCEILAYLAQMVASFRVNLGIKWYNSLNVPGG